MGARFPRRAAHDLARAAFGLRRMTAPVFTELKGGFYFKAHNRGDIPVSLGIMIARQTHACTITVKGTAR